MTAGATGGKAGLANGRAVVEKPPPMPLLPRLMPGGVDGVAVAFATAGRESVLAPGVSARGARPYPRPGRIKAGGRRVFRINGSVRYRDF